ncbi:hypothetical protein JG688_00006076 [Phytophthora aleatoria]|uniref:protein-tyrosine-phosphatase n=1 Tax=Phytophthora aleatoria TaxID=2496075 RepID=A0A8J5J8Y6_9STRA|nr:hypothetical protein JG688_00006076 [Phytophthora aleatoria]
MVSQCDVHVVLMLTNFVKPMDEKHPVSMGFIVRRLKVWNDKSGESRVIQHIQLTTWPDHGVLRAFRVIVPMLDAANCYRDKRGGATRWIRESWCTAALAGTFIAIDILLKQLSQVIDRTGAGEAMKQALDIPRVVYSLRSERPGMVQTPVQEQYQMIYQYVAAMVRDNQLW